MKKEEDKEIKNNTFLALAVIAIGLILLSLTFIIGYVFQIVINTFLAYILYLISDYKLYLDRFFSPSIVYLFFGCLIVIASWFVLNSNLRTTYKAAYLMVLLGVIYSMVGIIFHSYELVIIGLIVFICVVVLYYLIKSKQPWIYYLSLIFISILMMFLVLLGFEI